MGDRRGPSEVVFSHHDLTAILDMAMFGGLCELETQTGGAQGPTADDCDGVRGAAEVIAQRCRRPVLVTGGEADGVAGRPAARMVGVLLGDLPDPGAAGERDALAVVEWGESVQGAALVLMRFTPDGERLWVVVPGVGGDDDAALAGLLLRWVPGRSLWPNSIPVDLDLSRAVRG